MHTVTARGPGEEAELRLIEKTSKSGRIIGLESLRGAAALSIVVFHVRFLPPLEVPASVHGLVSTFGSSVPFFYAISAFSLFVGYECALERPDGLRKFYIRRFFRIAPLFYAMLVVHLMMRTFYYHAGTKTRDVLVNAAFAFGLLPGKHEGLVWASWSIGVEWLFYALFPLFLILGRNLWSAAALFIVGLLISVNTPKLLDNLTSAAPSFAYMCFLNQLAFFCAGVLAFRAARFVAESIGLLRYRHLLSWLLVFLSVIWLACGWFSPLAVLLVHAHLAVHWPAIAWMALLVATTVGLPFFLDNAFLRYAGRLSFGLYLTNPPVIFALFKLGVFNWFYTRTDSKGLAFALCTVTAVSLVMLTAQAAFTLIEHPGIILGDRVLGWLKRRSKPALAREIELGLPSRISRAPQPSGESVTFEGAESDVKAKKLRTGL
jgi:peptidoglycan/LPS O-acetylase OafA/YrhL